MTNISDQHKWYPFTKASVRTKTQRHWASSIASRLSIDTQPSGDNRLTPIWQGTSWPQTSATYRQTSVNYKDTQYRRWTEWISPVWLTETHSDMAFVCLLYRNVKYHYFLYTCRVKIARSGTVC